MNEYKIEEPKSKTDIPDKDTFKNDPVLHVLSSRATKISREFLRPLSYIDNITTSRSSKKGNIVYLKQKDKQENGYFVKQEMIEACIKGYLASTLSLIQDETSYHPIPKAKIFINQKPTDYSLSLQIASKDAHIKNRTLSYGYCAGSSENIAMFFQDPNIPFETKLNFCDIEARMLVFHEYDVNTGNFFTNQSGYPVKIDNEQSMFSKDLIEPAGGVKNLHFVKLIEKIICNEEKKDMYKKTDRYINGRAIYNLNINFFDNKMIDSIKTDPSRLLELLVVLKRINNYVSLSDVVKDYIFSEKRLGNDILMLPDHDKKQIRDCLNKFRVSFSEHLEGLRNFFELPLYRMNKLEIECQKFGFELKHKDIYYSTAENAIKVANSLNKSLFELKVQAKSTSKDMEI